MTSFLIGLVIGAVGIWFFRGWFEGRPNSKMNRPPSKRP